MKYIISIKKLVLLLMTMSLVCAGCDSEDEVDDVLFNTKWEYQSLASSTSQPEYHDPNSKDRLMSLINNHVIECSSIVEEKGKEWYVIFDPGNKPYLTNILIQFNKNGTCTYSSKLYNKRIAHWSINDTYTIKEQTPTESNKYVRVTSDGVFINSSALYLKLNDFKISFSKRQEEREEIEYIEKIEEEMNFKRTENEIIMTNENRKLYAVLDKEKWTLKVTQLEPKKVETQTLYLK